MAGSKVFQYFLLISFVIFSTHAHTMNVTLTEGIGNKGFEIETKINVGVHGNGSRYYGGCAENNIFVARPRTKKVVVYIRDIDQFLRDTLGKKSDRAKLWRVLSTYHYQLLYLMVADFVKGDEHVISEFLQQSIKPYPGQSTFQIDVIGEGDMDLDYKTLLGDLDTYKEDKNVFKGNLYKNIRDLYPR